MASSGSTREEVLSGLTRMLLNKGLDVKELLGFQAIHHDPITHAVVYEHRYINSQDKELTGMDGFNNGVLYVVRKVDLSRFEGKHILFVQSHDRSGESTENFAMGNLPSIKYQWYTWDGSPEEPDMYVPSELVDQPEILAPMIQAYAQHYIEGGCGDESLGDADEYGDVFIDLDTEECVFLCLGGDDPMEDDE